MTKLCKSVVPIFTLALLEVCYLIFEEYPKKIFDMRLLNPAYDYIPDFITKLLWLVIYVVIIVLIFKWTFVNERYLFKSEFFKDVLSCTWKILIVRLVLDTAMLITPSLQYTYAFQYIFDLLLNAFIFFIVFKRISYNKKIKLNKQVIIFTSILTFVSIVYVVFLIYKTKQNIELINYMSEKYITIDISEVIQNLSFELSLYTLLFNILSVILLYIIFFNTVESKNQYKKTKISLIVTRCILLFLASIAFCFLKVLLLPKNMIADFDLNGWSSHSYYEEKFDNNDNTLKLYRLRGYSLNEEQVYSKTTIKITYANKTIKKFKRQLTKSSINFTCQDKQTMVMNSDTVDHGDGIKSFSTEAIMYMNNDKPTVILTKDINNHKKDEKLTTALEQLISEGYFDFLEYSYEYMLKYDKDFIKPFLETYSTGTYDKTINENIKEEFIIDFSQKALLNDF